MLLRCDGLERFALLHLLNAVEHHFQAVGEDQEVRRPEDAGVLESALLLAVGPLAGDGIDHALTVVGGDGLVPRAPKDIF